LVRLCTAFDTALVGSKDCFYVLFCIARNCSQLSFIHLFNIFLEEFMNASHLTGPKESCKEKDLLHFLEAFLLRKTGLPTPRRCAPERKWVRALLE